MNEQKYKRINASLALTSTALQLRPFFDRTLPGERQGKVISGNILDSERSLTVKKQFYLSAVCLLVLSIAVLPAHAQDVTPKTENAVDTAQRIKAAEEEEPAGTKIIARIYAKRFKGRKTSSGEIYDPQKLTAAHPTLPLGTEVKVVNPANQKSVIVTINDRCRKRKELYIDLSRQAAYELGILRQGKATVRIIPLDEDEDEEDDDPSPEDSDKHLD